MPINTFANETEYNSHTKSTTESEVSLITSNNEVKYDGVNVEVTEPKFGDAVYVDNVVDINGKYGKHFIDGESLNPSLLPNGYTPVGVVVANEGNKVLIVYYKGFNNGDNTSEFQKGALFELDAITDGTQRSIVFQQVASTSPYGNVTIGTFTHSCSTQEQLAQELDTWLRANPGGSASGCYTYNWHCEYRQNYQGVMKPFVICDTVSDTRQFTTVVANGATVVINSDFVNTMPIITFYKRNNGANSERLGYNYERLLEYYNTNTTIANPTSNIPINSDNDIVSRTQFNENQYCVLLRNEYGTFENYIKSVMLNSLTLKKGLGIEFNKSLEWTKKLAAKKYNNLSGVETFEFPIHKWTQSIDINSEGFEAGTWYLPNVLEMYKINKDITYGLSGITTNNCDLLNKTLNKLGGNLLNVTQYKWINACRHRYSAWLLHTNGSISGSSIPYRNNAVACQFLLKNNMLNGEKLKLPGKCVLCDYFLDGYRFNANPTGTNFTSMDRDSSEDTYNLQFMNADSIFSDGIPYAVFDGVSGNLGLDYDLTDLVDQETGFTIEFLFKCPNDWSKGNMYNDWMITKLLDNTDNLIEPMLESSYQTLNSISAQVVNTENEQIWNWINNPNSLPTNNTSYHSWSHLAITVQGNQAIIFSNGNSYTRRFSLKTFTKPIYRLLNCLMPKNNYTRKTSKYQVTQFAVWNYPRYTSDFTVQNKLIIDKNYVV